MQRRLVYVAALVVALTLSAVAQFKSFSIVQITDMAGEVTLEIMGREELAELLKEVREETAAFPAALADARKEWEADEKNKQVQFQSARIKARTARKLGQDYNDEEKASAKKSQLEDRLNDKMIKEMDKEAAKRKAMRNDKQREAYIAREEARAEALARAQALVAKKLSEKLGREVAGSASVFGGGEEKK